MSSPGGPTERLKLEVKQIEALLPSIFWMAEAFPGGLWWRGQERDDWDLLPSAHRKPVWSPEEHLTFSFMRLAPTRYAGRCPNRDDYPAWLFLMQHYGLPTRLLDWSASPLVALFFALENYSIVNKDEHDAILWGLAPDRLNEHQLGVGFTATAHHSEVHELFCDAFRYPKDRVFQSTKVAAVMPDQLDIRHLLQQCMFTVHSSDVPLNRLPGNEKFIAEIRIPKESKMMIHMAFAGLGIRRSTLFPDLDNLAKELRGLHMRPINPPTP